MTDELQALRDQGRKRVLGVAGVIAAVVIFVWLVNRPADRGPVVDCGDLDARPADAAPLPRDRHCTLSATVQTPLVLTMGKENTAAMDEASRKAPLRYFVKLPGPVIAALPGGRPDVETFKRASEHLQGFRVEGVGRIFDPTEEKGYAGTGAALRNAFGIGPEVSMRVFDTADQPPE